MSLRLLSLWRARQEAPIHDSAIDARYVRVRLRGLKVGAPWRINTDMTQGDRKGETRTHVNTQTGK